MTKAEREALIKAREKLQHDLAWRGPRGKAQNYLVLDREQATAALAAIEAALKKSEPDK